MNEAEWEAAIDDLEFYNDWIDDQIVAEHYQEERMDEELEELYENLDFYSDWIDELEELLDEKSHKVADLEERQEFYQEWVDELVGIIASKNEEIAALKVKLEAGDPENLIEDLGFYADRIDELEEVIEAKDNKIASLEEENEHQKKVIMSLRNKNSQLVGDINALLDEKEEILHGYTTS